MSLEENIGIDAATSRTEPTNISPHQDRATKSPDPSLPAQVGDDSPLGTRLPVYRRESSKIPCESGAREAITRTKPIVRSPLANPCRASGADPANLGASTNDHTPDQQPSPQGGDDRGQKEPESHPVSVSVVAEIIANWRIRQRWHQSEKSLTLQAKAMCRSFCHGDKDAGAALFDAIEKGQGEPIYQIALAPYFATRERFAGEREIIEKRLAKLARGLPFYPFAKALAGFGDLRLASIVGEAGDPADYRSPSAFWKRMGLAVIGDKRQRKVADPELALLHGYSPRRRSVAWLLGVEVARKQTRNVKDENGKRTDQTIAVGPHGEWLLEEKARQLVKCAAIEADPDLRKRYSATGKYSAKAHAQNRAMRHLTKSILRDLWVAARACRNSEGCHAR